MIVAQLVVRQLDEDVKSGLQRRARVHGRSMEEEAREILRDAVRSDRGAPVRLGTAIASRFKGIGINCGAVELRDYPVRVADLDAP